MKSRHQYNKPLQSGREKKVYRFYSKEKKRRVGTKGEAKLWKHQKARRVCSTNRGFIRVLEGKGRKGVVEWRGGFG
jgi:hypothetical protein